MEAEPPHGLALCPCTQDAAATVTQSLRSPRASTQAAAGAESWAWLQQLARSEHSLQGHSALFGASQHRTASTPLGRATGLTQSTNSSRNTLPDTPE